MPLGTLDRTPPPFFRQGYSALTKLVFFSALALFLMVADSRLTLVAPLRAALASVLAPVQITLLAPMQWLRGASDYLGGLSQALAAEEAARRQLALQSERVAQAERLAAENARLRALLDLKPALAVRAQAAEVLYEAADPFSRKLVINSGAAQGLVAGSPVINEAGVVGQITRVYPLSAEVTLVTDKDAAISVLNTRTLQRGAAFGGLAKGTAMELRFVAANADLRVGDVMQTSGIDGVYPGGLAVAKVVQVERQGAGGFARVTLAPTAPAGGVRHVLVLEPLGAPLAPRPAPDTASMPLRGDPGPTRSAP